MSIVIAMISFFTICQSAPATVPTALPADQKMVRIVVRESRDGLKASPRTIYRVGRFRARIEEPLDRGNGRHMLVISNGRDHWMINRLTNTGVHVHDGAQDFQTHLPILKDAPSPLDQLEFGEEIQFLKTHAKPGDEQEEFRSYFVRAGALHVGAFLDLNSDVLQGLNVIGGREHIRITYDEYQTGLMPDESLFRVPEGVTIREAGSSTRATTQPATQPSDR